MIRTIGIEDIPRLLELIQLHASFERASFNPLGKKRALENAFFREVPDLYGFVSVVDEKIEGYTTYLRQYSTWDAAYYLYIDCLFLTEEVRGKGYGAKLMQRVRQEAERMGYKLIQWQTPPFNKRAISFYNRLGAQAKTKERFFWNL